MVRFGEVVQSYLLNLNLFNKKTLERWDGSVGCYGGVVRLAGTEEWFGLMVWWGGSV